MIHMYRRPAQTSGARIETYGRFVHRGFLVRSRPAQTSGARIETPERCGLLRLDHVAPLKQVGRGLKQNE